MLTKVQQSFYRDKITALIETLPEASSIQGIECFGGWASRYEKPKRKNATVMVYCTTISKPISLLKKLSGVLETLELPFNLVLCKWRLHDYKSNRFPLQDTPDRFMLFRSYTALHGDQYEAWKVTPSAWGITYQPSISDCISILQDKTLLMKMAAVEHQWLAHHASFEEDMTPWMKAWLTTEDSPENDPFSAYRAQLQLLRPELIACISKEEAIDLHLKLYDLFFNMIDVDMISAEDFTRCIQN